MSQAIQPTGTKHARAIATAIQVLSQYSDRDLEVFQKTVAVGASREELAAFLYLANRYALDPFLGEILLIRTRVKRPDGTYQEGLRVYVPRDGWLKVASRHPEYEGLRSAAVYERDEFVADQGAGSVTHRITSPVRGRLLGAYAVAYRKGRPPYLAVVSLEEVRGKSAAWDTHPAIMAQTRAEVYAIRRQFQVTGLYAPEEFGVDSESLAAQVSSGVVIDAEARVEPSEETQTDTSPGVTPGEYNRVYAEARARGWTPEAIRRVYRDVTGHGIREHRPTREEFERFRQALAGPPPTPNGPAEEASTPMPEKAPPQAARTDELPF